MSTDNNANKDIEFIGEEEKAKQLKKKNRRRKLERMLSKNNVKLIAFAAAAIVILLAAGIAVGSMLGKEAEPVSGEQTDTADRELAMETESETTPQIPLEENAYPEVNSLLTTYYEALSQGDVETIKTISIDSFTREKELAIEKRSDYIEAYNDLNCYTKQGPDEGSYVVYASYMLKFTELDAEVPGVSPFLVLTQADGTMKLCISNVDEEQKEYLEEISVQDDVVYLMNSVQVKFNETQEDNEGMKEFLNQMIIDVEAEVGEILTAEAAATQQPSDTQEELTPSGTLVEATDVVNIRSSDSEQADRIGKAQIGDKFTLLEEKPNGWSKIDYEGTEAYIKTEFLKAEGAEEEEQEADNSQSGQETVSTDIPASGTVIVADTVNVRESANASAERIGVCYKGEKLEILQKQADGWTKVKFNGKTGYVKTDVLKIEE